MSAFNVVDISHWETDFLPLVNALRSRRTITLAQNIGTDANKLWVLLGSDEIKLARWPGGYLNPAWGLPSVSSQFPDAVYLNSEPIFSGDFNKITVLLCLK